MNGMNRRRFLQSLAAVISLPAGAGLSLKPATAALPTAAAVPAKARFWAIYMSGLHGECTPQTLQNLLHIPEVDAKKYISHLIADGVIKPNPLLQKSVSKVLQSTEDGLFDKVKKRLDMKRQIESDTEETSETVDPAEHLDSEMNVAEGTSEEDQNDIIDDDPIEAETALREENEVGS